MECTQPVVLVVGATGKFARMIVPELRRRNVVVRALVRDEARAAVARSLGVTEIALGDLRDTESLTRAMPGVDGIFHIGPAFTSDEAAMGVALVEAAQQSSVRKFVFSSVIQPTNARLANHASKIPVENALYSSRLEYTILHPANFMQNIGLAWPSIRDHACFGEPFPKNTRIARVDYRDVAEIAAVALTDDRLAYATLELCAGMFSRMDIVATLSEALGYPVAALQPGFSEWAAHARLPYGEDQLLLLAKVFDHYQAVGLGGNSLALRAALGREPRSLREYIKDLIAQKEPAIGNRT
ncbi:NmrA/HSCARG family protein [Achromobacter sp. JUb104]|uniref:NmrA/HSCARG family protein n=1 Tax=Achromobacter sp. JUb104 TaxID=2940590 RepID=UPI00286DC487|nr:NmrA/HSCARG family protein [Achromobacter sp. JUb104]